MAVDGGCLRPAHSPDEQVEHTAEVPLRIVTGQPPAQSAPLAAQSPAQPARNPAAAVPALQGNTPVRVGRERKGRSGKTVSIITGVQSREAGQQALLKLLKNKLGTGGTLEDSEIIIQGDHRERIVEILNELGYKAKVAGG